MRAHVRRGTAAWPMQKIPLAAAMALIQGMAWGQGATSAESPFRSDASAAGQPGIAPRSFTSFVERLSSPVDKILVDVADNNLPADGLGTTEVRVQLQDAKGQAVKQEVQVTIEVNADARVVLPGQTHSQSAADRGDVDRIEPGTQTWVRGGELVFKLVAPTQPQNVQLRVSVRGVMQTVQVRYVPHLREMIVVGLLEAQLRSDKFNPQQIVPVRENDGFDNEIRAFSKEFHGGASRLGARAALYLKGKVQGEYLLTLAYDSEKDTRTRLFQDIDPNAFYPVYGDSSVRGIDAQSTSKLYVRLDKGHSYILWGDMTTADGGGVRQLSLYSRSMLGLRGRYEQGGVSANAFVSHQSQRQVVDEFPARGVSGPYAVSNPNGIAGSEKIEILVRDRNQRTVILKTSLLTRSLDYEFEPFSGQIVFKSPVPSFDDQLNPVSIRVTYEVEQGGARYLVYGADAQVKASGNLTVGLAVAKDENPQAPFAVYGAHTHLKLSKQLEFIAEVAHTSSVVNAPSSGFNVNTSNNFANKSGQVQGNAYRAEMRYSGEELRARAYVMRTDDDFNNASAGVTGGKQEAGVSGTLQISKWLSLNAEVLSSQDRIANSRSSAATLGADWKFSDKLTLGAGVRKVSQNVQSLTSLTGNVCSNGATGSSTGYNTGYGISQQGNQQIDLATGLPVLCSPTSPNAVTAPADLDRTSAYARATYRLSDTLSFAGELQRELGADASTLYRVGADWQLAPKTRLYSRYERARTFGGAYGLGVGSASNAFALGMDTQYMQDGALFTEYRLNDAADGRQMQTAVGLRNGWKISEGLRLSTSAERLNSSSGQATALALGVEYTGSEFWKGSSRIEWRQDAANTNVLFTASVARKLADDWTLLGSDYYSLVQPRTVGASNRVQNRFQLGMAYRPVQHNKFDALAMVERKTDHDKFAGTSSDTDIYSVRANYHPSRPWWLSGRVAYKRVNETLLGSIDDSYHALLFGTRLTYDLTNRWSVGALLTTLQGKGGARQHAYGLEAGYVLADNLLVTLGYNWRGFRDDDLTGSDYTNRGWVLGMRYKFDETLFGAKNPAVNKTLTPGGPAQP